MKHDSTNQKVLRSPDVAAVVARYRNSDLGLESFARQHGIPAGRLRYWVYQKNPSRAVRRAGNGSEETEPPVFQEVRITASERASTSWAAEVSLPKGLTIRFGAVATPAWIGSVVQVLQQPC